MPRVAAIVLAAGRSRRFGAADKLLADLDGEAVLSRTLRAVAASGIDTVLVVTGGQHAEIAALLADFAVRLVRCPDDLDGIGHSIAAGARALDARIDGALILPGDMPLVSPQGIQRLVDVFQAHRGERVVHAADRTGAQRNPVLWPRAFFADLARLEGPSGGKSLLATTPALAVPAHDDTELLDIDDAAALADACALLRMRSARS